MLVNIFWWIRRWKMVDIRYLTSKCPSYLLKKINEKFDEVFNKLDSGVEINIALGFVLRNIETGEYRFFYLHENNSLLEKSDLLCSKADLISIQGKVGKT